MIYYYVHTGHRFGLDRFRKAVAIINSLPELNIRLLTSDFRIASGARDFGINGAIGIDVLRNIPNIANHGDILIYDSDEHNETQHIEMLSYFKKFIRLSLNPNDQLKKGELLINPHLIDSENVLSANPISQIYFDNIDKSILKILFYGDDDYDKFLYKNRVNLKNIDSDLLLGFYYFLGYENELKDSFKNIHENEEYANIIKKSKYVITFSFQTALETLASNGIPIFVERIDRPDFGNKILEKFGVPILQQFNYETINNLIVKNHQIIKPENNNEKIRNKILSWLK